jgi:4-aminobutyrate aminotransferase-like enzyme/Ser/Thr protein kinase RdoA (MazF antagonist)
MVIAKHAAPTFSAEQAEQIAEAHYGLRARARLLPGEHDQNFLLESGDGARAVLKISHADEDYAAVELQVAALQHLAARAPDLRLPHVHATTSGAMLATAEGAGATRHLVRLVSFLPGTLLANSRPHSDAVLLQLGRLLGQVDQALLDFEHPAAHRALKWDIGQCLWARAYLGYIDDPRRRALVARHFDTFEGHILPRLATLRHSVIHNDANDYNVVVEQRVDGSCTVALIDFGDMLWSVTVAELAIACAYAMLDKPDPLAAAAMVVAGYHAALPLDPAELAVLFPLICARLAVSVTNAAYQHAVDPGNPYLQISARPAWRLLELLEQVPPALAEASFRNACGLEPCPSAAAVRAWLAEQRHTFGPALAPDPSAVACLAYDLSVGSADMGNMPDLLDAEWLEANLRRQLRDAGAVIGVGRYDEARLIYHGPMFHAEGNQGPERRSVHIGLDLFAPAGTPVYAPLAGVVHSVQRNPDQYDYGPTIILEHRAGSGDDAPLFYTLYGHLADDALTTCAPGDTVAQGQQLATLGTPDVNGGWPPHLHVQVICDLLGQTGTFPGVCRPSERAVWTSLCPDPNLVVGLDSAALPPARADLAHLLEARHERIGHNLSISYQRPLHIVRGFMQYLYDSEGRAYLDSVNNVPHVGHSHPRVVRAAQRQMAVLNTNTRYLHENLLRYAERLTATLPAPLRVCYFVCSGSEATELALRLARAHTGQRDLIVSDAAYHGNTTTLIDISPYKSEGSGGKGLADWVHKAPMPDGYRGPFTADDPQAGWKYAQALGPIVERTQAGGRGLSAFIIESLLGCGGPVVLPPGYLAEVYRIVRAAGGVCIADEVQVGFGRVGTHFWGFETQGVVPDIVAMGKPIGNGHPLAAVVTTPEIAASFDNGMEYFNTYGGNPVSCAVGLAVLDVIADEGLQQRALTVGGRMLAGLRELGARQALIGEARGQGLMLGVELVRDRSTLEPAAAEASYVANRKRERGIQISTDGPLHNVLKIKPPLVYAPEDADRLVSTLDQVLGEDVLQC